MTEMSDVTKQHNINNNKLQHQQSSLTIPTLSTFSDSKQLQIQTNNNYFMQDIHNVVETVSSSNIQGAPKQQTMAMGRGNWQDQNYNVKIFRY